MSLLKITVIIIGALALLITFYLASLSFITRHPRIKPVGERQLSACPSTPNCVSSLAEDPDSYVAAFSVNPQNPSADWDRLLRAIQLEGGEILVNDGQYLHAVFSSRIFRFKDDLEAVLSADHIDIRSASRAGKSDLGQNRKRVEKIRQHYLSLAS